MTTYQNLKEKHTLVYQKLNENYNRISVARVVTVLALLYFIYQSFTSNNNLFILFGALTFLIFIFLMKVHDKIAWKRKIEKQLISINNDEIIFLKKEGIPFENGAEYIDFKHFYSFDLDFFGNNSIFQNLNRTATYIGSKKLSYLLLTKLKNELIVSNQQAISELSKKIEWRQYLLSLAKITKDNQDSYQKLMHWSEGKRQTISKPLNLLFHLTPIAFFGSIIIYFVTNNYFLVLIAITIFLVNLLLAVTQLRKIKNELIDSEKISTIVKQYGLIIEKIEKEKFKSEKLNQLQEQLVCKSELASHQIKKLAGLFSNIQSIENGMGAILFNGAFLYHIHTLNSLLHWKKEYANEIKSWLDIIGEFETLNSLSNFSYNNPTFVFPTLNENHYIEFEALGHPLIAKEKRVCNDITFNENNFVILTGSNMSGKSTFLRTLGINMVLAGIGAPICATKANIHPLNVIVSMRQSDSLNDSESYFFAEVKRLKQIIDKLENEVCFVLLDEILKGTNSDDKQSGTIAVIKKIISKKAIGAIATHDLEVCQTTNDYPNQLTNKCFEVAIINNDLSFDYKLRDGICKNKSATFLMEKMEII